MKIPVRNVISDETREKSLTTVLKKQERKERNEKDNK
jgi:hypothetical protein